LWKRESLLFSADCDILELNCHFCGGMWRSLVAHFVRDEGAAGSNPVIPILDFICRGGCFSSQIDDFEFL
jgi:hypothetical protein